jgi:hypothetical protein
MLELLILKSLIDDNRKLSILDNVSLPKMITRYSVLLAEFLEPYINITNPKG